MDNQADFSITKIYELIRFFHMNHGYAIPGPPFNDTLRYPHEYWIFKVGDPNYQLIRVTSSKASASVYEEKRIEAKRNYMYRRFGFTPKFLDIHVSNEEYDPSYEKYDYSNIDYNFHNGVDLEPFYPGIYSAISKDKQVNDVKYLFSEGVKIRKAVVKKRFNFKTIPITFSLIGICIIVYFVEMILTARYSDASAYIIMGADYKTFTLGLKQYYRLITNAFLHGSLLHLISNMISLFYAGKYVENLMSRTKYVILLLVSILVASLTQGIMTENSLLLGMSGGIYGIFTYLMISIISSGAASLSNFIPTILVNVYLNFLSRTAWLAHLGGAVAGLVMFMIYNRKDKRGPFALLVVMICFMIYRYLSIKTINPFYQATDMEVANIYYEWGLKDYSVKLIARLLEVYKKFGG